MSHVHPKGKPVTESTGKGQLVGCCNDIRHFRTVSYSAIGARKGEGMAEDLESMPTVLTVAEAARALRIGRNAAYTAVATNVLGHFRLGRTIRVPRAAILKLISEGAVGSAKPAAHDGGGRNGRPTPG